jgi:hypothetical protein
MSNVFIGAISDNAKIVRLEKWIVGKKSFFYIINDKTDEPMDGFSRKYSAIDSINRLGYKLKKGPIKVKS